MASKDSRFGFFAQDNNSNLSPNVSNQGQRPPAKKFDQVPKISQNLQPNQIHQTLERPVPNINGSCDSNNNNEDDGNNHVADGFNHGNDDNNGIEDSNGENDSDDSSSSSDDDDENGDKEYQRMLDHYTQGNIGK